MSEREIQAYLIERIAVKKNMNYEQVISPSNLFKNKEEVIEFLKIESTKQDMECFLNVCLEEELYEFCTLIKERIDAKT